MNNKERGTQFEKRMCRILAEQGWWTHFIEPKMNGAQPFDIIAVKDGVAVAIDCKTSAKETFSISRLEDNQIYAFEKWMACGNNIPQVFIEYRDSVYCVDYTVLKENGRLKLKEGENGVYCFGKYQGGKSDK